MLSLRLQRTGRKGYALYRLVAQDSHRSPTSGKVAAYLGSYNPHNKEATINKEKVEFYLKNGAQPSPRVAVLIKKEGVKLPGWYKPPAKKKRAIKHPEKLRKNRPAEAKEAPAAPAPTEEPAEPAAAEEKAKEKPAAEEKPETKAEAKTEPKAEKKAEPKSEAKAETKTESKSTK